MEPKLGFVEEKTYRPAGDASFFRDEEM